MIRRTQMRRGKYLSGFTAAVLTGALIFTSVPAASVSAAEDILSASEDTGDIGIYGNAGDLPARDAGSFPDDTPADTVSDISDGSTDILGDISGDDADVSGNSAGLTEDDISGNAVDYTEAADGSLPDDTVSDNDIYAPEGEADTAYHTVTINFTEGSFPDKFTSYPYICCFLTKNGKTESKNISISGDSIVINVEAGTDLALNSIGMRSPYLPILRDKNGKPYLMKAEKMNDSTIYDYDYNTHNIWPIGTINKDIVISAEPAVCYLDGPQSPIGHKLKNHTSTPLSDFTVDEGSEVIVVDGRKVLKISEQPSKGWYGVAVHMGVKTDDPAHYYVIENECYFKDHNGRIVCPAGQAHVNSDDRVKEEDGYKDERDRYPDALPTHYCAYLPPTAVYNAFVSGSKLILQVIQTRFDKAWNVYYDTDTGIEKLDIYHGNKLIYTAEYYGSVNNLPIGSYFPKYGSQLRFVATPKKGYKIASAQLESLTGKGKKTFTGKAAADLKYTCADGTYATFRTEPVYHERVFYINSNFPEVPYDSSNRKYDVSHDRYLSIYLMKGEDIIGEDIIAKIGNKDVTKQLLSEKILDKSHNGKETVYHLKGDHDLVRGKRIEFTIFREGTSKKHESARSFIVDLDDRDKTVEFADDIYSIPAGVTERKINALVRGNVVTSMLVNGAEIKSRKFNDPENDVSISLSEDNRTLTVTGGTVSASEATPEYTVQIVEKTVKPNRVYDTVAIVIDHTEIIDSPAPSVSVTGTTNNSIKVSIKDKKIDTSIDGLYYKVSAKRISEKPTERCPLKDEAVKIISAADSSCTLNLLRDDATEADIYDGDPTAVYEISTVLLQKSNVPGEASTVVAQSEHIGKAEAVMKEGGIFETDLKLDKPGKKTKLYSNLSRKNCALYGGDYRIGVRYSSNTSIRRLERVDLLDNKGRTLDTARPGEKGSWLDVSDDLISIYPGGNDNTKKLAPGSYKVAAYTVQHTGNDVCAVLNVKVLRAVEGLTIKPSPGDIPVNTKKDIKIKFKAYDTGTGKRTTKVRWEVMSAEHDNYGWHPVEKPLRNKGISISKKGVLKISKNVKYTYPTCFYVKVTANDYAANRSVTAFSDEGGYSISITDKKSTRNLGFSGGSFHNLHLPVYKVNKYFTNTRFGTGAPGGYNYYAYVSLTDKVNSFYDSDPAKFSVEGGSVKIIDQSDGTALLGFKKPGRVKIKARSLQGNGSEARSFTLEGLDKGCRMAFGLWGSREAAISDEAPVFGNLTWYNPGEGNAGGLIPGKTFSYDNHRPLKEAIPLEVIGYNDKTGEVGFIKNAVKVKGGKLKKATKNNVSCYYILPTSVKTTVTLSDKRYKKNNTIKITINNKAIAGKNAPSAVVIPSKKSIYGFIDYAAAGNYKQAEVNRINYDLGPAKKNKTLEAQYAIVSLVKSDNGGQLKNALEANSKGGLSGSGSEACGDGIYAFPVKDGAFSIDWSKDGCLDIKNGTYKFRVTPANKINTDGKDRFVAAGKAVTVDLKVIGAPEAKVSYNGNIILDDSGSAVIDKVSEANIVKGSNVLGAAAEGKGVLKNDNIDGRLNGFADRFIFNPSTGTLTLKDVTADPSKIKKDLTGYVAYKYQSLNGRVIYRYQRISVNQ